MTYFAGIDIGSMTTKCVIVDTEGMMIASAVLPSGARIQLARDAAVDAAIAQAGIGRDQITSTIATGYGRKRAEADGEVTEITCHARGAVYFFPGTRTILDIGGQDTKAIRVDANGNVGQFAMNDKCAAGTGRFLEVMARALEVDLADMGPLSLESTTPCKISSFCTVFGESEVVSHVANGAEVRDIAAGLNESISQRVIGMLKRVGIEPQVTMSGGVSRNMGMRKTIEKLIGHEMNVSEHSQVMGALGAALVARERWLEDQEHMKEEAGA